MATIMKRIIVGIGFEMLSTFDMTHLRVEFPDDIFIEL